MLFYSTKHQSAPADLEEVVMQGLPPDNGLYMPDVITPMPAGFWEEIDRLSFPEMSYRFAQQLLQDSIPPDVLRRIVYDAVNFEAPVVKLSEQLACLELFHGPSLAFKDFGARFMARMMAYFVQHARQKLYILVATSGDTGGAVAQGFLGTPGIEVIILYPSGKISELQEKQLTTLGNNITALEVQGTFDDCQHLVKQAFLDQELRSRLNISSANSINLARLIPQAFYYIYAWAQVKNTGKPVVFCVPSGNFGNLTAGLLAKRMGLPANHFVAANNANDVFTHYHRHGQFLPRPSVQTYSNAMDVGNPSNLQRIQDLYGNNLENIRKDVSAYSFTDAQTITAMQHAYSRFGYVMCPHTAVGYLGINAYFEQHPQPNAMGIFLGTAHPAKFLDVVEPALQITVPIPQNLQALANRQKVATPMSTHFADFKEYLEGR
ncbi:MAG TPA: threonine synthase [Chitinophagales bacterium]|nr:threonine synthase [Chitinophagales bacterium]HRK27767.1 threonine synthase [Chitinophagales bacterium]